MDASGLLHSSVTDQVKGKIGQTYLSRIRIIIPNGTVLLTGSDFSSVIQGDGMDEDTKTIFAMIAILISYTFYKEGVLQALFEDRVAITVVLTSTTFFLWFFRRKLQ